MRQTLDHFARTEAVTVCGMVREKHLRWYQDYFQQIMGEIFQGPLSFDFVGNADLMGIFSQRNPSPLLIPIEWPSKPTPEATPQTVLNRINTVLSQRGWPFWQVAVIDPDSRLFTGKDGPRHLYRTFEPDDFQAIATGNRCSVLLTGGDATREQRWGDFLEALATEELPHLPADWHFMPPLSQVL